MTRFVLCASVSLIIRTQICSRECTYPEPRPTPNPFAGSKGDQAPTAAVDSRSSSDGSDSSEESAAIERRRTKREIQQPLSNQASFKSEKPSPTEQPRQSVEHIKVEGTLSLSTEASSVPGSERPDKCSSVSTDASQEDRAWSHLSQDLQFYLEYHTTRLNYHHLFLRHDANHFLHNILIEHALQYNPLLYAVVAFAAFQSSVTRADGKIQDLLCYYKSSVSLLGKSLVENQKHTDATLLTILQLATLEVRGTTNLPSRADNVQRITWAIGSACLAIKKLPMACF